MVLILSNMTDFYFKIFNSTWTVTFIDNFKEETKEGEFKFGETDYENNRIRIATKTKKGDALPEKTIELTVLHEMMHAICGTGQYGAYSEDEPFMEWLANCIYSIKEQGKL